MKLVIVKNWHTNRKAESQNCKYCAALGASLYYSFWMAKSSAITAVLCLFTAANQNDLFFSGEEGRWWLGEAGEVLVFKLLGYLFLNSKHITEVEKI